MGNPDKKKVEQMFDEIAGSYDLLNHLLSFNIDKLWRRKAVHALRPHAPELLLDVATGTGDFALEALRLNPRKVLGVDLSAQMLEIGRRKIIRKKAADKIELLQADSTHLPFKDHYFDAVTVGFGVRNFEDPVAGLLEMHRVLKPGGMAVILEFTLPDAWIIRKIYRFYFHTVLPLLGRIISRNLSAYQYLPESVETFEKGVGFLNLMKQAGFHPVVHQPLTFGICGLYKGYKNQE